MAGVDPLPPEPAEIAGLRIGVPRGQLFGETEDVVAEAFESTLERLARARAGARITALPLDDLVQDMSAALPGASIAAIEAAAIHADLLGSGGGD